MELAGPHTSSTFALHSFSVAPGLGSSQGKSGSTFSIGFLFPSCHGWQRGMCQDSTEEPLTDEEGQEENEGFWLNYVEAVHKHRPTGIAKNVSKNQRLMYENLLLSPKLAQIHLNPLRNSVFVFYTVIGSSSGFQNFKAYFIIFNKVSLKP